MKNRKPENRQIPTVNGLTCIHQRIHCAATQEGGDELSEVDRITIEHFLETLAEVAMSVASRNLQAHSERD